MRIGKLMITHFCLSDALVIHFFKQMNNALVIYKDLEPINIFVLAK
jgi:hypothetical protein